MLYGILKIGASNTGSDADLQCVFTAPITIYSNQPSYSQDSLNLKRKTSRQNVQRWEIETRIAQENSSANFLSHSVFYGHSEAFNIRMPQVYGLRTAVSSSTTTTGAVNSRTVSVSTPLTPGEFFNFVGQPKVYMCTNMVGNVMDFEPSLVQPVSAGTQLVLGGLTTMRCVYDTNVALGISYTDGVLSDPGSVKLIEVI